MAKQLYRYKLLFKNKETGAWECRREYLNQRMAKRGYNQAKKQFYIVKLIKEER